MRDLITYQMKKTPDCLQDFDVVSDETSSVSHTGGLPILDYVEGLIRREEGLTTLKFQLAEGYPTGRSWGKFAASSSRSRGR